jgi:all-trans-retinol 13,14-reductase
MLTIATLSNNVDTANMRYPSYKQQSLDDPWDAIVIGSGIGGLATAALLSSYAHKKVLVLERHYTAGGYTHVFHRPGYEWDIGLHYIGQVHDQTSTVRQAFDQITDGQLQWQPMPDVYDRFVIGDRAYEFVTGVERFRARLNDYFPQESTAIDRYIKAVQSVAKATDLYFAEKAVPRPIAFLFGRCMRAPLMRWAKRTTADVLGTFTRNEELIGLLTAQWGDYGLPPRQSSFGLHAIVVNHYLEGASYPIGGASRVAETIAPVIERAGGKIVVNAEVAEVLLDGKTAIGVRMADGREIRAPIVVSDAGARNTFERLLPRDESAHQRVVEQIRHIPPSSSHLCLYVGLKESAANLGLAGTNIWVHPTPDHDANLQKFTADPKAPFPTVYISFPSAKDPDFERRHPGRATVEVVTFTPYHWFHQWQESNWRRRGADYDAFKEELSSRLQEELVRQVPALAGKIDHAELSTPLSTRYFMNYQQGEMYGLSGTPERFRLRCLTPKTPIRGLYLTGQDVASLGVTGALFGGVLTASAILRRNLMSTLGKRSKKRNWEYGSGYRNQELAQETRSTIPAAANRSGIISLTTGVVKGKQISVERIGSDFDRRPSENSGLFYAILKRSIVGGP